MKAIHGDIGVVLPVGEDLAVHGRLGAGASVADGCTLFVHGVLDGALTIGREARVVLGGTLGAIVEHNRGTLAVAGAVATPVETIPGALVVAAHTAVTVGGRTLLLTADGVLRSVLDVVDVPVARAGAFRWDGAAGAFLPTATDVFDRLADLGSRGGGRSGGTPRPGDVGHR